MSFHYHGIFQISEKSYDVLKRMIPILDSPDFSLMISVMPINDDDELKAAVTNYLISALIAIKHLERIQ
jgi:hypothetical protein